MKRIIAVFMIIIIISSTFEGCDFKDIDRRLFIVAIGIDLGNDIENYMTATFKAAITSSQDGNSTGDITNQSDLFVVKGNGFGEILRLLKTQTSREPDFSHMKIVIFSKDFAQKYSVDPIVEFMNRRRDFQNITWVTVSDRSTSTIMSYSPKEERFAGDALFMKLGEGVSSVFINRMMIYKMFSDASTPGVSPNCSLLEIKNDKLVIERAAILGDGKIKMILSPKEAKTFNMLYRGLDTGYLQVQDEKNKELIELGINKMVSKYKIRKEAQGKISCNVTVKGDCSLESSSFISSSLEDISKELSEKVRCDVTALLKKLQENNLDPLGLEIKYAGTDSSYNVSERWLTEKFPNIEFNVTADIDINGTGWLK